jgi:hypothetical protein
MNDFPKEYIEANKMNRYLSFKHPPVPELKCRKIKSNVESKESLQ